MRVLVLTPTFLPIVGGAELVIYEVYRRLARSHQVCVLTPEVPLALLEERGSDDYCRAINFEVERFNDRVSLLRIPGQRASGGIMPPFSLSAIGALARSVRRFRPEAINAYYAVPTGLAAILVQRLEKVPTVLTFIGRDVPGPRTPFMWKYYDRLIARAATEVTYTSHYCRLALYGSLEEGKGRVIYGGVDIRRFTPEVDGLSLKRKLGIAREMLVLFTLQRLSPEKRTDVVIRSMDHILPLEEKAILIVGGKGPEAERLRRLADRLGLGAKVLFTGYIPEQELPQYFAMADLFLFHSLHETFGLVLAQAMAAGKPVVSVRSTAITEVIDDNRNGILVEPMNPEQLATASLRLMRDAQLRARLAQNARKKAVECFDWDKIATQYEEVLAKTVARGFPSRRVE